MNVALEIALDFVAAVPLGLLVVKAVVGTEPVRASRYTRV